MRGITEEERRKKNWVNYFEKAFAWAFNDFYTGSAGVKVIGLYEIGYEFNSNSTEVTLSFYGRLFTYRWNPENHKWDFVGTAE